MKRPTGHLRPVEWPERLRDVPLEARAGDAHAGRRSWGLILCGAALAPWSLILAGCPGPSFSADKPDTDGGTGGDPACAALTIDERCGVFVAPTGSDETGSGRREAPYQTINKAIIVAEQNGKPRVFVCKGAYEEAVTVLGGIAVFGGLACDDQSWATTEEKSVLSSTAGEIPLRFKGGAASVFSNFAVNAANATAPSGSSIAVMVEPNAVVDLQSCDITAGNGASGAAPKAPPNPPVTMGVETINYGKPSCTSEPPDNASHGGAEHLNNCGDTPSIGGAGGDGNEDLGEKGQDGKPTIMGSMTGMGGTAQSECSASGDGKSGGAGTQGMLGAPGQGVGALSLAKGWVGVSGAGGGKGSVGQGGGGGAGQVGKLGCPGASGGSGGAGGCGGEGGVGGQPGGSSIGIVSISAVNLRLDKVTITTGKGGKGGKGGDGQFGGPGAEGADGGMATQLGLFAGCKGGNGGEGGRGGPGGGGAGGHSIAVAYFGNVPMGSFVEALGAPGAGGEGGDGDPKGNIGDPGVSQKLIVFETQAPN